MKLADRPSIHKSSRQTVLMTFDLHNSMNDLNWDLHVQVILTVVVFCCFFLLQVLFDGETARHTHDTQVFMTDNHCKVVTHSSELK